MKKIITSLLFVLAFSVNGIAQEKKAAVSGYEQSKQEAYELVQTLGLEQSLVADFASLFEMRREVLENPEASLDRKAEMVRIVGLKIQATLNDKQLEKLMLNKPLYSKITGETDLKAKKD